MIPLDIAMTPPPGTYIQIASRSGLAVKHYIDTKAGVIDSDYNGNITVVLHNHGTTDFQINIGDRIAQLLILHLATPNINITDQLPNSSRGHKGFGSTGTNAIVRQMETSTTTPIHSPVEIEMPYNIYMSQDPFDQIQHIDITIKGDHPTLGMHMEHCIHRHRLKLTNMAISTPGSRIPKWRSILRNSYLLTFDNTNITTLEELQNAVHNARQRGVIKAKCTFAIDKSHGIHPHQGIPQLYFDQLNTIAQHLKSIDEDLQQNQPITTIRTTEASNKSTHSTDATEPCTITSETQLSRSFKLSELQKGDDWPEWQQSRYKMLDQYLEQGMFSDPIPLPQNANALHMLWTYLQKICGTRKSGMVCNVSRRQKGTVTLGHTYANSLDAASERLFWAIVAKESLIAIGADVSNAFAEAPPPTAPLYLYIDDAYREWWTEHLGKPPIPKECNVVRVHNAIQGHPEASRLWEKHIDLILKEIGLRPATHEPCIYIGTIDEQRVIFLRQVDDFAVAAKDETIAWKLINKINSKM